MNYYNTPKYSRPKSQSAKAWFVWAIAALFPMYQFMLQGSPSVMIHNLSQDLSITLVQASFITTYFFYSYIVMQIPAGILVDLFGPRILLIIGSAAAGIACMLFSGSKCLWVAETSRLIMGFVCSVGIVSVFYLITQWFESRRFALVVGFTETLGMAGAAFVTILLAFSVEAWGWRTAIFLCGVGGVVISLLVLLFVRNQPNNSGMIYHNYKQFSLKKEISNLTTVVANLQGWLSGLFMGLVFSTIPAFFALWGIPYFMDHYHISASKAAGIVAFGLTGASVGGPLIGAFSDYIKRRKIIMILGSFLSLLIMSAILYFAPPIPIMFALTFSLGFTCSCYVVSFAIFKDIMPRDVKGKAMGFANMLCLIIGAPILQPTIALLVKRYEPHAINYTAILMPVLIALVLALIISFFIKETYCIEASELEAPKPNEEPPKAS